MMADDGLEAVKPSLLTTSGKFLDLRWSGEEGCMVEGRLRSSRGLENDILLALSMNHLTSFDDDRRSKCSRKSALKRGTDTRAN